MDGKKAVEKKITFIIWNNDIQHRIEKLSENIREIDLGSAM